MNSLKDTGGSCVCVGGVWVVGCVWVGVCVCTNSQGLQLIVTCGVAGSTSWSCRPAQQKCMLSSREGTLEAAHNVRCRFTSCGGVMVDFRMVRLSNLKMLKLKAQKSE